MPSYVLKAYKKGEISFYGNNFYIDRSVLVPRKKTETVVSATISRIVLMQKKGYKTISIVDVGTGSGVIIITVALKADFNKICLFATDISKSALDVATRNAERYNLQDKISFIHCDLITELPINPDIIVANLPYSPRDSMSLKEIYEPKEAHFDEGDGTIITIRLFQQIDKYSFSPGAVILETSPELVGKIIDSAKEILSDKPRDIHIHRNHESQLRVVELVW